MHYVIEELVIRCTILFVGAICGLLLGMAIVTPNSPDVTVDLKYRIVKVHGMPCLMDHGHIATCDWSNWIQVEPTPDVGLVLTHPTPEPTPIP